MRRIGIKENVACCMRGIPAWCLAARREERHVERRKKKKIIEEPLENVISTRTLQWMNWQTPTRKGGVSWFGSYWYEPQTRRNLHAPCIPALPLLILYTIWISLFSFKTRPPFLQCLANFAITLLYFLPPTPFMIYQSNVIYHTPCLSILIEGMRVLCGSVHSLYFVL